MQGKIIKNISDLYTVLSKSQKYICKARGKFRNNKLTPLVGDEVLFDDKELIINEILPRSNELNRPNVANIDYALIVTSVVRPSISYQLLDKLIINCIKNHIKPIIIITKTDLITKDEITEINHNLLYYDRMGYKVFKNTELEKILKYIDNKFVVVTGQTGAGKSTFINHINPDLKIDTNEISEALGRGKHTTRHTEAYQIGNTFIIDTPGFGSSNLLSITKDELPTLFEEFNNYQCKFKNCKHINEKDCEIKKALLDNKILPSRYDNYLKFMEEVNENSSFLFKK